MRLVVRRILGADDHRKTVNELLTSHDAFNSVTKFARHDPLSHSCRLQGSNHRRHTLVEHREVCHDLIGSRNEVAGGRRPPPPAPPFPRLLRHTHSTTTHARPSHVATR